MVNLNFINQSNDKNNSRIVIFGDGAGPGLRSENLLKMIGTGVKGYKVSFTVPRTVNTLHIGFQGAAASNKEFAALGITGLSSADIVMTGGAGQSFHFSLENIVKA